MNPGLNVGLSYHPILGLLAYLVFAFFFVFCAASSLLLYFRYKGLVERIEYLEYVDSNFRGGEE